MIIELDIFCLREEQIATQEMGISVPFEDCLIRKFSFVNIDWFSPRSDSPKYTTISSGGSEFVCTDNYEGVNQKITQANLIQQSLLKFN